MPYEGVFDIELTDYGVFDEALAAGVLFDKELSDLGAFASVSISTASDNAASAVTVAVSASTAVTVGADNLAGNGAVAVLAALTATIASDNCASAGAVAVAASLAHVLTVDSLDSAAAAFVSAALSAELSNDALAALAEVLVTGTSSIEVSPDDLAALGNVVAASGYRPPTGKVLCAFVVQTRSALLAIETKTASVELATQTAGFSKMFFVLGDTVPIAISLKKNGTSLDLDGATVRVLGVCLSDGTEFNVAASIISDGEIEIDPPSELKVGTWELRVKITFEDSTVSHYPNNLAHGVALQVVPPLRDV